MIWNKLFLAVFISHVFAAPVRNFSFQVLHRLTISQIYPRHDPRFRGFTRRQDALGELGGLTGGLGGLTGGLGGLTGGGSLGGVAPIVGTGCAALGSIPVVGSLFGAACPVVGPVLNGVKTPPLTSVLPIQGAGLGIPKRSVDSSVRRQAAGGLGGLSGVLGILGPLLGILGGLGKVG